MRTPYTDDGSWTYDPVTGRLVQTGVPALLATDASGNVTGLAGPGGTALVEFDASGNLIAQVNLRTGPVLADLLALAGGDGEVSVSQESGKDALVLHTGTAGQAKALYRNRHMTTVFLCDDATPTSVPTATATQLTIPSANKTDDRAYVSGNTFVLPLLVNSIWNITCVFDSAAGTYRRVILEMDATGGGAWAAVGWVQSPADSIVTNLSCAVVKPPLAGTTAKFRVSAEHDAGVSADVTIEALSCEVYEQ